METYFAAKTLDSQVPVNILNEVKETFSRFEVVFLVDGTVVIKVPQSEKELKSKLHNGIKKILQEIECENSVLAKKLAHRYGIKQLK